MVPLDALHPLVEGPDRPEGLPREAPEDYKAGHAAEHGKGGHLEELHARAVEHLQRKQGACARAQLHAAAKSSPCAGSRQRCMKRPSRQTAGCRVKAFTGPAAQDCSQG